MTDALRNAYGLHHAGRLAEAMAGYREVLRRDPRQFDALYLLGVAHLQRGEAAEADRVLEAAARLNPRAEVFVQRGHALMQLRRPAEALVCYDRAAAIAPDQPWVLYNRANAASIVGEYGRAIADCEAVLAADPDHPYARGVLVHAKLQSCDWRGLNPQKIAVSDALSRGKRAISPFNHKALSDSPEEQLRCAETWVANECPPVQDALWRGERYRHARIRLGYVSADLNASAVTTLMASVFEHHDRSRFETIAISLGSNAATPERKRLEPAFERFVDVSGRTDVEIANLIPQLEIDVAVDLMGFTGACRTGIFARRPAPIQVNFLGFPGTMGAPYMDYIVADPAVIPPGDQQFYTERVAYLPDCYLPHDRQRGTGPAPTRAACGLPESGFVFASFNNTYKFTPEMFDVWMRLLSRIPGSVLWLPASNPAAQRNLSAEAESRGVDPTRIVFASYAPKSEDHLARLAAADLFLDTRPYNAHTTAMDALWAGLPVLTCEGRAFAGRVAASLLRACGLPELVTQSLADYEALAFRLANDPAALGAIRTKLRQARATAPLFDTVRFTRHLEAAFATMSERHQNGEPPAGFAVERDAPAATTA